jgi:flavin-dependent dehydrogenase
MFDVIISGAGPAGAVAATVLARAGARVLVCDRASFPRDKLCGDTINPGTCAALRRLDLTRRFEDRALRVDGMVVTGESGAIVRGEYGDGIHGLAILRRDLDAALIDEAAAAGARVEQRVLVRGPLMEDDSGVPRVRGVIIAARDGRDIRIPAPLVIAADGRRSRIAMALGLSRHPARPRRWAIGAYFSNVQGVTTFGEMHVRSGRYVGVAAVPSGLVNVCLVTPARAGFDEPAALLLRSISEDWHLAERFASARMMTAPVVMGPLAIDTSEQSVTGLLLAGDASGFIDPMTGDGLRFAVCGGELAATIALRSLDRRTMNPEAALARMRRRTFARKWRFNRALRALVGAGPAIRAAGVAATIAPSALRRVIAFAGDVAHV